MSNNKQKYTNPSILTLVSRIVKKQNNELIDDYGLEHNLSPKEIENLKKTYIKLNHIYPNVVQRKNSVVASSSQLHVMINVLIIVFGLGITHGKLNPSAHFKTMSESSSVRTS